MIIILSQTESGAVVEEVKVSESAEVPHNLLFDQGVAHLYNELHRHQLVLVAPRPPRGRLPLRG
jgi:hypothetical protein